MLEFSSFDHFGFPAMPTPYDKQYREIKNYLMKARYSFTYKAEKEGADYWQLPFETEYLGTGDCEDQSIWLYAQLTKEGIDNIRLVAGKYKSENENLHVWINLYIDGHAYIIDPTMDEVIWRAALFPPGFYKPLYSYHKDSKWTPTDELVPAKVESSSLSHRKAGVFPEK